jgi:L-Ala-D/L-Glu epimerase
MSRIEKITFHQYRFGFKTSLKSAHGERTGRQGWIVVAHSKSSTLGFGDIAPWPGFGAGWDPVVKSIKEFQQEALTKKLCTSPEDINTLIDQVGDCPAELRHGLESALIDLLAKERGVSFANILDPWACGAIRSHALVNCVETAEKAVRAGYSCIKVKVAAEGLDQDVALISAIRDRIGFDVALRLDANCGWDFKVAQAAVKAFEKSNIDWIEQPLAAADLEGHAKLRTLTQIPIALDESLGLYSLDEIMSAKAADAIVIKPMFCGGILTARKMILQAQDTGIVAILTNALESAVGRQAAVHLAASLPFELPACGFSNFLAEDWCELDAGPRRKVNSKVSGLDVDPSEALGLNGGKDSDG